MKPRLLALSLLLVVGTASMAVIARPAESAHGPQPRAITRATPAPTSVWATERGGFNYVGRIHAVSADSVWAVGSNTVHFDGAEWRAVDRRDADAGLKAADVLPSGYGWVVGGNEEAIPIRDGVAGPAETVPGQRLEDVAVVSEAEVWAVASPSGGGTSSILRYRNGQWQPEWTAPDGFVGLAAIWMHSATDGWAVGSTAVHYDGTTWTEWPLPAGMSATRVGGTAPNDVWAVGGDGPWLGLQDDRRWILHFDGTGWNVALDEIGAPLSLLTVRGDEGFALTWRGDVFGLRDGSWRPLGIKVPAGEGKQIFPYVTDIAFVPGERYAIASNNYGWFYRVDEASVSLVRDAGTIGAVAMLSDHMGWALGRRAMVFDGTAWTAMPESSVLHRATDITVVGAGAAWAVGPGGFVAHYASGEWVQAAFPLNIDLTRVVTTDDGGVWALGIRTPGVGRKNDGSEAALFERDAAGAWREVWRGAGVANDVAIGGGGHRALLIATSVGVWRGDGTAWTQISAEGAASVGIGPGGELWAGEDGQIRTFDGSEWTFSAFVPRSARVNRFHSDSGTSWAVANMGYVLAFRGGEWQIVRGEPDYNGNAGQSTDLHDLTTMIRLNGQVDVWAVGEPDTILHAAETDVLALPAVTPAPTDEPWPDFPYLRPQAYLPLAVVRPPFRNQACRDAPGADQTAIEHTAVDTARYYAADGPAPEPKLEALEMMTAAEIDRRHGVTLAGVKVGERTVRDSTCVWWATFNGWFDAKDTGPPSATPASPRGPDHRWTRLDLALFAEDATVFYEGFTGQADVAPPTATAAPPEPTGVGTPRP